MQADAMRIEALDDVSARDALVTQVLPVEGYHYDKHPCFAKRVMTGFTGDRTELDAANDISDTFAMSCDDDCPTGPPDTPVPPFLQGRSSDPSTPTPSGPPSPCRGSRFRLQVFACALDVIG